MHEWCLMRFSMLCLGCFNSILRGFTGWYRCILKVAKRFLKVFSWCLLKKSLVRKNSLLNLFSLYIYFHQNQNSLSNLIIIGFAPFQSISAVHIHEVQDVPWKRRCLNHNAIYFWTYLQLLPTMLIKWRKSCKALECNEVYLLILLSIVLFLPLPPRPDLPF